MEKCVIRKQTHSCLDFIISKVPGSNQQSKFYHFQFTFILWIYQDPVGTIFIIGDITKIRFQKTKLGGTLHSQSVSCVLCAHTIALFFCKSLFFFLHWNKFFLTQAHTNRRIFTRFTWWTNGFSIHSVSRSIWSCTDRIHRTHTHFCWKKFDFFVKKQVFHHFFLCFYQIILFSGNLTVILIWIFTCFSLSLYQCVYHFCPLQKFNDKSVPTIIVPDKIFWFSHHPLSLSSSSNVMKSSFFIL